MSREIDSGFESNQGTPFNQTGSASFPDTDATVPRSVVKFHGAAEELGDAPTEPSRQIVRYSGGEIVSSPPKVPVIQQIAGIVGRRIEERIGPGNAAMAKTLAEQKAKAELDNIGHVGTRIATYLGPGDTTLRHDLNFRTADLLLNREQRLERRVEAGGAISPVDLLGELVDLHRAGKIENLNRRVTKFEGLMTYEGLQEELAAAVGASEREHIKKSMKTLRNALKAATKGRKGLKAYEDHNSPVYTVEQVDPQEFVKPEIPAADKKIYELIDRRAALVGELSDGPTAERESEIRAELRRMHEAEAVREENERDTDFPLKFGGTQDQIAIAPIIR